MSGEPIRIVVCSPQTSHVGYAFMDIIARVEGDRIIPIANPRRDFPTKGNAHVRENQGIPPRGQMVIWQTVLSDHRPRIGSEGTGHMIVGRKQDPPIELREAA